MIFDVIYSFDCPWDDKVGYYLPPKEQRRLWTMTEGDEQYELDIWEKGKHRKLCADGLTRKQFDEFVKHCSMVAESTETMGSLTGVGWKPAISFNNQDEYAKGYANAYVTPYPSYVLGDGHKCRITDEEWQKRCWERVKKAVVKVYG